MIILVGVFNCKFLSLTKNEVKYIYFILVWTHFNYNIDIQKKYSITYVNTFFTCKVNIIIMVVQVFISTTLFKYNDCKHLFYPMVI